MIRALQKKFCLVVWAALLAVIIAVITAVNIVNWQQIYSTAESELETLSARENDLAPPGNDPGDPAQAGRNDPAGAGDTKEAAPGNDQGGPADTENNDPAEAHDKQETPPPIPEEDGNTAAPVSDKPRVGGQPGGDLSGLTNYYTVSIDHSGNVNGWASDRSGNYTDSQVETLAQQVLASGKDHGRIGSQFYLLTDQPSGETLTVLDKRIEMNACRSLLITTCAVGAAAWALLCAGAHLLIRQLVHPVSEAFEKQKQFVWDASHELKTPLAVISANADALSREIGENEWLGYIRAEIERSDKMIGNMLTLAQLDHGAQHAEFRKFNMSRALMSILLPFESAVYESGETLNYDIPEGIILYGDENMVAQVTGILMNNAVKYAGKGGVITVQLRTHGDTRIMSVHNTGAQLTPRDKDHIFERFYRSDAARGSETSGSGLGLAIAHSLVEAMGGRIEADSPLSGGTRFTVTLKNAAVRPAKNAENISRGKKT